MNQLARANPHFSIRIREYTSRSLIDDAESAKRVSTKREWTDEDYTVVFQKLLAERRWLTSLKLEVRGPMTATARIWRDATFSCQEGFPLFVGALVPELKDAVVRSRGLFENRGRSTSPTGMSRPLRIVYTEDVFSQVAQLKRLRRTLDGLRDSALSVMHPNPYFHATLLDYADGSSYQVWVTTPSSILIVPKKKATTESMERVCNHICNEFEEGDIEEFGA